MQNIPIGGIPMISHDTDRAARRLVTSTKMDIAVMIPKQKTDPMIMYANNGRDREYPCISIPGCG